jgi:acetyl esterase/lipase
LTKSIQQAQIVVVALMAMMRRSMRRVVQGPSVKGWTWSEELFVAASRAMAITSARHVQLMAPRARSLAPPLPRALRAALTIEAVDLDGVPAMRFVPPGEPAGTILYFHGGGFVSGSAALEARPAAENALGSRCDTYSVDYRLAPAHQYPAALDDATTAYRAVIERGADPATTILFGGSAGACLALSTLLNIRELGLPRPAGAVLLWPYADFTFSGASIQTNADIDMLPVRDLAAIWGPAYVGDHDPADPLVSPALADLTDLPPLLVIAGGAESLLSCAELIADNARRAGVEVQLSVYPDKVHGWMILPKLPSTLAAVAEIRAWIARRLGVGSP